MVATNIAETSITINGIVYSEYFNYTKVNIADPDHTALLGAV